MSYEFRDLPISYRIAQGGLVVCVFVCIAAAKGGMLANGVGNLVALVLGPVVAIALLISSYVIIRYPYLSLAIDNDLFTKHTSRTTGPLARVLGVLATIALFCVVVAVFLQTIGRIEGGLAPSVRVPLLCYLTILFFCVAFLTFIYSPSKHPTIATFIQVTLGIGIFAFPFFLPAIAIGGYRCHILLEDEMARQEFGSPTDHEETSIN